MKEDLRFILQHPILTFVLVGTITGFIPALAVALLEKIF